MYGVQPREDGWNLLGAANQSVDFCSCRAAAPVAALRNGGGASLCLIWKLFSQLAPVLLCKRPVYYFVYSVDTTRRAGALQCQLSVDGEMRADRDWQLADARCGR